MLRGASWLLIVAVPFSERVGRTLNPSGLWRSGNSNTAGFGVGAQHAYPAYLEAMLRARGHDAQIWNAGACSL
jgi:hypothetical protein